MKMVPWTVFGAKSRPGRLQERSPGNPSKFMRAFLAENCTRRGHVGAQRVPKSVKNLAFGPRSAQGPSKNDLWKGVWKKHEILMKSRCNNLCFLIARNHVWRYTLRLFHTFAIFEKIEKSMPKGRPNIVFFDEKWHLGRPRVDLFCHFGRFSMVRKSLFFRC